MIYWTESHDKYTLKANEWEVGLLYLVLAGVCISPVFLSPLGYVLPLCGFPAVVLVVVAIVKSSVSWLEVPLQGGGIRWGVGVSAHTPEPIEIERFDIMTVIRPLRHGDPHRYTIAAVLPNGERKQVLANWDCFPPARAQAIIAQLNGILGHPESPPEIGEAAEGRVTREKWAAGCLVVLFIIVVLLIAFRRVF